MNHSVIKKKTKTQTRSRHFRLRASWRLQSRKYEHWSNGLRESPLFVTENNASRSQLHGEPPLDTEPSGALPTLAGRETSLREAQGACSLRDLCFRKSCKVARSGSQRYTLREVLFWPFPARGVPGSWWCVATGELSFRAEIYDCVEDINCCLRHVPESQKNDFFVLVKCI